MQQRDRLAEYSDELLGMLNATILRIMDCDLPLVAAVDGQVNGGAIGLVLACDLVVVTERASFTPYYVDVGFSPDGGWTAMLPGIIGLKRASAVQLLNQTISAQQAVDWGIAFTITQSDSLEQEIASACRLLVGKKAGSLHKTKQLLNLSGLRERLQEERRVFVETVVKPETIESVEAFLHKSS